MTAGAYGAVQAGTYNTRALVPEVLVSGAEWALIRPRLDVDTLIGLDGCRTGCPSDVLSRRPTKSRISALVGRMGHLA